MTRKRLISSRFPPLTFPLSPSPVLDGACRVFNSKPFFRCQVFFFFFFFGSQVHSGWKPHTLKTPENTARGHENGGWLAERACLLRVFKKGSSDTWCHRQTNTASNLLAAPITASNRQSAQKLMMKTVTDYSIFTPNQIRLHHLREGIVSDYFISPQTPVFKLHRRAGLMRRKWCSEVILLCHSDNELNVDKNPFFL